MIPTEISPIASGRRRTPSLAGKAHEPMVTTGPGAGMALREAMRKQFTASSENRKRKLKMTQTLNGTTDDQISVDEWLAIRKEAGLTIDPRTAEVMWTFGYGIDPYGVYTDDLTEEEKCIGRIYFARSPGSEIWVHYYDLTAKTLRAWRGSEQERRSLKAYDDEIPWLSEG